MKVLVADKFETSGIAGLRAAGCEVISDPDLKDDALKEAIARTQADVLVVRGTKVTEPMLETGSLSLVVRAGAGYNTIDVAAASRRGIYVSNCPGKNAIAVAELTFALILAIDRRIPDNVAELRAGHWNKKEFSKARGLFGRTLGLLGYGAIGQEVAKRAIAFGMPVVVWSRRFVPDPTARPAGNAREGDDDAAAPALPVRIAASARDVADAADVLSLHLALTPETRGFVDQSILDALKPGSYVVNTARGEIMDYRALERVVRDRNIRVGLDVFPGEPSAAAADFVTAIAALPT